MLKQPDNSHIENWDRFSVETLRELADEHGVELTSLSGDWVQLLEKDDRRHLIIGLDWGLNTSSAQKVAFDKCATAQILSSEGIPVVPHKLFLEDESLGNSTSHWKEIVEWFHECSDDVVCKPNTAGGGRDVVRVQDEEVLREITGALFEEYRSIAISPYVVIQSEYRVTVLDGEALLSYEKVRADENELKFNLSSEAKAIDIEEGPLKDRIINLALQAAETIGIMFANIDVVRVNNELYILEINSQITFKHYTEQGEKEQDEARKVYEKAFAYIDRYNLTS